MDCNSPTDMNNEIRLFVVRKFNMFKDFQALLFAFPAQKHKMALEERHIISSHLIVLL